ncbi:hypothetical protein A4G26_10775 [Mycobacterium kansasii]|uniref:Uncharacterized protein n=1 Tax=Mycobacterium innocens TaxID=2341083 RepID=A0A498Q4F6_9MYCO|nr:MULTISPECIES: hypothetical protein [Mycobacterium]KZS62722.1 hypothetical protein A4G26_10775 [Mycobacterium kansasii]VBA40181.1 hypothetical protein LAUMK13_02955 [Mycobacterium innocens]
MHAGLKSGSAVFAALGVLAGTGVLTRGAPASAPTSTLVTGIATTEAAAEPFTPGEQQVARLLPPGYAAGSCTRATNPFPAAIASLDCTDDLQSDTPDYARFTLYDNVDLLTADFYATAESMAVSPCPGGNASPGTWNYGSSPGRAGGKIVCGSIEDRADLAWTRDAQLLLATVNGGPSLNDLYRWWLRFGGSTES